MISSNMIFKINKSIIFIVYILLITCNAFTQDNKYEVYAIKFGSRNYKIPIATTAVGSTSKDSVDVYFMFWLLTDVNGKKILVDAGFTEDANPVDITFVRPDLMLEKINVKPEEITDIILTHPHWDHIGGIDLYPNAMVWMQKEDYNYFVGEAWQKDGRSAGFHEKDVLKILKKNLDKKLTLVKGDGIEIIPGINVFIGSKHTYESQYVLVNTPTDKVIIASDNSWFYYNLISGLPIPATFDSKAYTKNLKRMKRMVSNIDFIIPGHDPLLFSKFPKVAEDVVKIGDLYRH